MGDILGVGRGWIREKEGGNLNCEQAQGFWRLYLSLGWPESVPQCVQAQQMDTWGQGAG